MPQGMMNSLGVALLEDVYWSGIGRSGVDKDRIFSSCIPKWTPATTCLLMRTSDVSLLTALENERLDMSLEVPELLCIQ